MAPHLSAVELDHVQKLLQNEKSPVEIHRRLSGFSRPDRPEAGYLTSGRLLWDAPHLIKNVLKRCRFGASGRLRPPDGFPAQLASTGVLLKAQLAG